jgi:hypothetical protein
MAFLPMYFAPDDGICHRIYVRKELVSRAQPRLRVPSAGPLRQLPHEQACDLKRDGLQMNARIVGSPILLCKSELRER